MSSRIAKLARRLTRSPEPGTPGYAALQREIARQQQMTYTRTESWGPVVLVVLWLIGAGLFYRHLTNPRYVRPTVAPHRPLYENTSEYLTPPEQEPDGDWDGCTGGVHPTC
ncbi:hypothetical protein [Gemmatimonas sp. UBA7669]|uniref:hypothetical protein n=1 Tax=Gemmatimonas sp. UBA7669 TaxID=1946568 RepID=UPI0025BFC095|nr:hypothetical protein [Gemmatimonas sp. UBA7669]